MSENFVPTQVSQADLLEASLITQHKPAAPPAAPAAPEIPEADLKMLTAKLPTLLWGDPEKPEAPPAAPAAPVAPAALAAPAAPAAPAPAEPAGDDKTTVRPAAATPDFGELGRSMAASLAAELKTIMTPAAAPALVAPVADPAAGLSPQDRRNYEAFVELASKDPGYKTHPQRFLDYVGQLRNYRASWIKDNPGKKFDLAEHEEFVDQHQPSYDDSDLSEAATAVQVRKAKDELRKEMEAELAKVRAEASAPAVDAEAVRRAGAVQATFLSHLPDSDVKKTLATDTGVKDLQEKDPVAYEVLNTVVGELQERIGELHKIHNRNGYFNPGNPVHSSIATFVRDQELAVKNLPAAKQVHQGRQFATYAEMAAMPEAQRSRHWTLSENDIADVMTRKFAAVAAKNLDVERTKLTTFAAKYGYSKVPAATPATPATPPATPAIPATPAPAAAPAATPPAGGGDLLAPTTSPAAAAQKTQGAALLSSLWG